MPKETGFWDSTTRVHLYLSVLFAFYIAKKQQTFSSLWFYIHYYLLRSYVLCTAHYTQLCVQILRKLEWVCLSYYYEFWCSVVFCLTFSTKGDLV